MDQSGSDRSSPPGTISLLKNGRIRSARLQKRCGSAAISSTASSGYRALSDTTSVSRPVEHPAFIRRLSDQRIAATTAGYAFTFDSSDREQYLGEFSAATPVRKRFGIAPGLAAQSVGPYMPAVAASSTGYVVTAAFFGPELRITLESPEGALLDSFTNPTAAASNGVVRIVRLTDALFYVLSQDIASTTINRNIVQVTSAGGVVNGSFSYLTLANASSTWDVSRYDGTTWFVVYQTAATTVTISERNNSGTQITSATFTTTDNRTYLSIWADPDTDRIWIGIVDDPTGSPTSQFRVYTDALVLSVGPTSLAGTGGVPLFGPLYKRTPVAGDAFCVYADSATSPGRALMVGAVIQAGALTREVNQAHNVVPISKPDAQQRVWVMTYGSGSNFEIAKVLLVRCVGDEYIGSSTYDPTPVVELASPDFEAPGDTYHPFAQPGRAFNSVAVTSESSGGSAFFAFPFVVTSRTNASGNKEPTHRVETYQYTRWNQEPHRAVAVAGLNGFVAGQPTELWGIKQALSGFPHHGGVELGFAHGPSVGQSTITAAGGGLAAGSYDYYAVQVWSDDEGNEHLSAPSAAYSVTLTAPSSVELRILNCEIGQRPDRAQPLATRSPPLRLYRTVNGGTDAQEVPLAPDGPGGAWAGYLQFTDTVADSVIRDNEFLYTGGGVLPNVLAPSCRYIAVSEERLWCGGLWEPHTIECSKVKIVGEPYNFTGDPSHQIELPGEVTGLAYQDGQIGVFCEDAIYVVGGDGPNDQGAGGFPPPRALIRGVGCPRSLSPSILETEAGILFRSKLGYYLIPRGWGSPVNIGEKVQDEDDVVLSAATTTTAEFRLARFLVCASGETKSDTVLTLDLTSMQWARDEYTVNGSITAQGFSEIGEWPDGLALFSYGLQRTDNLSVIWAESESLTGDAGAAGAGATTFISLYLQTAWQYGSWGPMGWGQLKTASVLFEAAGACGLNMTLETDDNADQTATQWTIAASSEAQFRTMTVKFDSCAAYRLTLYDAATSGNSSGLRLIALGFDTVNVGGMRPPLNSTERQ